MIFLVPKDCTSTFQVTKVNHLTFAGLVSLQLLDLSFNSLETLPDHVFSGLRRLEVLLVATNRLHTLHHHTFQGLHALQTLELNSNKLGQGSGFDIFRVVFVFWIFNFIIIFLASLNYFLW